MGERMSREEIDSSLGRGHRLRYHLASGFVERNDTVLDAASGIGYGQDVFLLQPIRYVGVDLSTQPGIIQADLQTWQPDFSFDVGISFETIEHLDDYSNLLDVLRQAKKWVVASVPVIPTKHMNPWHKHDFAPQEFPYIFLDGTDDWEYWQYLSQPTEFSEIYVFKHK
jgi:hypothetical protein